MEYVFKLFNRHFRCCSNHLLNNDLCFTNEEEVKTNGNDPIIQNISAMRGVLKPYLDRYLIQLPESQLIGYRQRLNIITDAIVFAAYSDARLHLRKNLKDSPVFLKMDNEEDCKRLFKALHEVPITFENVLEQLSRIFSLDFPFPTKISEYIMKKEELKNNPQLRFAFQMYFLRGHFSWVSLGKSQFSSYLLSDQTSLPATAKINCWEAVMYGMVKAGMLDKQIVRRCYEGDPGQLYDRLSAWFQFEKAEPISSKGVLMEDWKAMIRKQAYFIMLDHPKSNGMKHDLVSIPYSQKQLLKMILTNQYNEKFQIPKIYSHWTVWTEGTLGSVQKKEFEDRMKDEVYSDFRIHALQKFASRAKKLDNLYQKQNNKPLYDK